MRSIKLEWPGTILTFLPLPFRSTFPLSSSAVQLHGVWLFLHSWQALVPSPVSLAMTHQSSPSLRDTLSPPDPMSSPLSSFRTASATPPLQTLSSSPYFSAMATSFNLLHRS
ncbi:unnamed protein product [Cuscuta epithymum]|uniref:Uncharacterized protein n=1 Tax=Cuscuta epithymum TaxID=186058 RepID=A0AAV0FVU6_9ASTE|nr:unnamed protein product [Cuscuta epithymum]